LSGRALRLAKHLLVTRPIFHKLDDTIRGHVFCSFLALVLKKALEDRITALGRSFSWPDILADLKSLTETEIEQDGKRFLIRSAPRPGGEPGASGRRRCSAAHRAIPRRRLTTPDRKCSAKPPTRLELLRNLNALINCTVEDGLGPCQSRRRSRWQATSPQ
jgi:hypothetical protein